MNGGCRERTVAGPTAGAFIAHAVNAGLQPKSVADRSRALLRRLPKQRSRSRKLFAPVLKSRTNKRTNKHTHNDAEIHHRQPAAGERRRDVRRAGSSLGPPLSPTGGGGPPGNRFALAHDERNRGLPPMSIGRWILNRRPTQHQQRLPEDGCSKTAALQASRPAVRRYDGGWSLEAPGA